MADDNTHHRVQGLAQHVRIIRLLYEATNVWTADDAVRRQRQGDYAQLPRSRSIHSVLGYTRLANSLSDRYA
jgi:hypothetical protein